MTLLPTLWRMHRLQSDWLYVFIKYEMLVTLLRVFGFRKSRRTRAHIERHSAALRLCKAQKEPENQSTLHHSSVWLSLAIIAFCCLTEGLLQPTWTSNLPCSQGLNSQSFCPYFPRTEINCVQHHNPTWVYSFNFSDVWCPYLQNHKLVLYKVAGIWQQVVGNLYSAPHKANQVLRQGCLVFVNLGHPSLPPHLSRAYELSLSLHMERGRGW